jgi:hypothetical protein
MSGKARTPVAGEVPNPLKPPPGCTFNPRCPHAREKCRVESPPLAAFRGRGRRVPRDPRGVDPDPCRGGAARLGHFSFPGPHTARPAWRRCVPRPSAPAPRSRRRGGRRPRTDAGSRTWPLSAMAAGSNTTTSANMPSRRNPRPSSPRLVAGRPVKRRTPSSSGMSLSSRTYLPRKRAKLP